MLREKYKERNMIYKSLALLGRITFRAAVRYKWQGISNLPKNKPFIVCPNHLTNADPIAIAHILYVNGYTPKFLAKGALFRNKTFGFLLDKCGQIPVYRDSNPSEAFTIAKKAILNNSVIVMYPEGTFTRDPKRWPMKGKTGAVRLALETGAPIVPVAHWGLLDLMPIGTSKIKITRPNVTIQIGKPLDLSAYYGQKITKDLLETVTAKLMDSITRILEDLRGEKAPKHRWDIKHDGTAIYDDNGNFIIEGVSKDS